MSFQCYFHDHEMASSFTSMPGEHIGCSCGELDSIILIGLLVSRSNFDIAINLVPLTNRIQIYECVMRQFQIFRFQL